MVTRQLEVMENDFARSLHSYLRAEVDVLRHRTVGEGVLKVVGIDTRAMGDDKEVVSGGCHGNHSPSLQESARGHVLVT